MQITHDEYTTQLAGRYSKLAPVWTEKIRRMGFCRAYDDLFIQIREWMPLLRDSGPKQVLDMGIGSGDLSHSLVKLFPIQIHLAGVDISRAMLQESESKLAPHTLSFTGIHEKIESTGLPAGQYDLVLAAHVLEHLEQPNRGFEEIHRLLKPGMPLVLVMTRCNIGWLYLSLQWQIHCSRTQKLRQILPGLGFENIRFIRLYGMCNMMSLACIAFKKQTYTKTDRV